MRATVAATWRKSKDTRVRARLRYLSEDISDNEYLEQSLWTYAELVQRAAAKGVDTSKLTVTPQV